MRLFCVLLLVAFASSSPAPSIKLSFKQRGLPDLGKTVDVKSLMELMMNDPGEGSGFQEMIYEELPKCPFECHCSQKVVQCSDLGECLCSLRVYTLLAIYDVLSIFEAKYMLNKVQYTHSDQRPQNTTSC